MSAELCYLTCTFRKIFSWVARIVKDPKNECISFAWRVFCFLPIQKNRLQKKVRRFWTEITRIIEEIRAVSIGKSMEHRHWFSNTIELCLKIFDLKSMSFSKCVKPSNFLLKMNFLDRLKIENPSCERDTFIFRVFYDRSNSGISFSKKCTSCSFALRLSTNFQNVIQDAVHIAPGNPVR